MTLNAPGRLTEYCRRVRPLSLSSKDNGSHLPRIRGDDMDAKQAARLPQRRCHPSSGEVGRSHHGGEGSRPRAGSRQTHPWLLVCRRHRRREDREPAAGAADHRGEEPGAQVGQANRQAQVL